MADIVTPKKIGISGIVFSESHNFSNFGSAKVHKIKSYLKSSGAENKFDSKTNEQEKLVFILKLNAFKVIKAEVSVKTIKKIYKFVDFRLKVQTKLDHSYSTSVKKKLGFGDKTTNKDLTNTTTSAFQHSQLNVDMSKLNTTKIRLIRNEVKKNYSSLTEVTIMQMILMCNLKSKVFLDYKKYRNLLLHLNLKTHKEINFTNKKEIIVKTRQRSIRKEKLIRNFNIESEEYSIISNNKVNYELSKVKSSNTQVKIIEKNSKTRDYNKIISVILILILIITILRMYFKFSI